MVSFTHIELLGQWERITRQSCQINYEKRNRQTSKILDIGIFNNPYCSKVYSLGVDDDLNLIYF